MYDSVRKGRKDFVALLSVQNQLVTYYLQAVVLLCAYHFGFLTVDVLVHLEGLEPTTS